MWMEPSEVEALKPWLIGRQEAVLLSVSLGYQDSLQDELEEDEIPEGYTIQEGEGAGGESLLRTLHDFTIYSESKSYCSLIS